MGGMIAFLLFVLLCIYIYKANHAFVPEDPERYGLLLPQLIHWV